MEQGGWNADVRGNTARRSDRARAKGAGDGASLLLLGSSTVLE